MKRNISVVTVILVLAVTSAVAAFLHCGAVKVGATTQPKISTKIWVEDKMLYVDQDTFKDISNAGLRSSEKVVYHCYGDPCGTFGITLDGEIWTLSYPLLDSPNFSFLKWSGKRDDAFAQAERFFGFCVDELTLNGNSVKGRLALERAKKDLQTLRDLKARFREDQKTLQEAKASL